MAVRRLLTVVACLGIAVSGVAGCGGKSGWNPPPGAATPAGTDPSDAGPAPSTSPSVVPLEKNGLKYRIVFTRLTMQSDGMPAGFALPLPVFSVAFADAAAQPGPAPDAEFFYFAYRRSALKDALAYVANEPADTARCLDVPTLAGFCAFYDLESSGRYVRKPVHGRYVDAAGNPLSKPTLRGSQPLLLELGSGSTIALKGSPKASDVAAVYYEFGPGKEALAELAKPVVVVQGG